MYLLLFVCFGYACTNDEMNWYGSVQELAGTEWESTVLYYGGSPELPPGIDDVLRERTEILHFGPKEFAITITRWTYNYETQEVEKVEIRDPGTYEYIHPKIKLTFEDGSVVEAFISARNTIYYNDEEKGSNQFARK